MGRDVSRAKFLKQCITSCYYELDRVILFVKVVADRRGKGTSPLWCKPLRNLDDAFRLDTHLLIDATVYFVAELLTE